MQCMIITLGNQMSNSVWEATLESSGDVKPIPTDSREKKEAYIRKKYIDKAYVDKTELSKVPTDQNKFICSELYNSICSLNIMKIIQCIALGATNKCLSDENYESRIVSALSKICKYPPSINIETSTTNNDNDTTREENIINDSSFLCENSKRISSILYKENSFSEKHSDLMQKYSHSHNPSSCSYNSYQSFSTTIQSITYLDSIPNHDSKFENDSSSVRINNDFAFQDQRINQLLAVSVMELIFQNFNIVNVPDDIELDKDMHHPVLFTKSLQPIPTITIPKRTLLHYAALLAESEKVSYLIQKGANPLIKVNISKQIYIYIEMFYQLYINNLFILL